MITLIRTMTINQIIERKNDLLVSDSAIKELARNERNQSIDEFAERLKENYQSHAIDMCLRQNDYYSYSNACYTLENYIDEIAEQLKGGAE